MKCIHLKIKTKDYQRFMYCSHKKKKIDFKSCENCKYKEFKQIKELKKKSKKLKRLEARRFSIITDNLKICYICNKNKKQDLHEAFGGSNRQKSMKFGLVIPVCRLCHKELDENKKLREELQQIAKEKFIEQHSKEKFREEFRKKLRNGGG